MVAVTRNASDTLQDGGILFVTLCLLADGGKTLRFGGGTDEGTQLGMVKEELFLRAFQAQCTGPLSDIDLAVVGVGQGWLPTTLWLSDPFGEAAPREGSSSVQYSGTMEGRPIP